MKKIIVSLILCISIITGVSGSTYAYEISPQKPFIGDVETMNRTFIKDIKELSKTQLPLSEASIIYTEDSTYLYIVANYSTNYDPGLYYIIPAICAGYYPGKLDFVYTEIRMNNTPIMSIQIDGDTSAKYAAKTIDENDLMKKSIVQQLSTNNTQINNSVVTQTQSDAITSKINGNFRGFKNGAVFKLTNNQIWEQTSYEYEYTYKYSPEVTIYKDGTTYYMLVDGMDTKVKVKRIK
ncbi:hypothetical protein [Paenibacillus sp. CGMCC 1.18879]|uniref:hypothetical protein n=1 Tax=Paenibacillus sp. CGMCC 1.18879 TaxID=2834466 RepID=UPI001CA8DBD7|nr:hypothetical protein [Paenibacillus sp. CGMCC 1.18879]MBY9081248.1 hypothetical protein [Paenibacillus sp. CGMCC 1.18879]